MDLGLRSCVRILRSCKTYNSLQKGKQIHLHLLRRGVVDSSVFIVNCLLQMYTRCCDTLDYAQRLFDGMPQRDCFSWNTLIEAFLKSGNLEKSLELFNSMPRKNNFSWNLVISGFAKSGDLEVARRLFNKMPKKNGYAWNSMIHGYAYNGHPKEAMRLFKDLNLNPDETSHNDTHILSTIIGACTNFDALYCAKQVHTHIIVNEVNFELVLWTSLVNMYAKCGDFDTALCILYSIPDPDDVTLSALVTGYMNCGRLVDARRVFDRKSRPCVVLWNSMIAGYISNNEIVEALNLYNTMQRSGIREDPSTFASVLSACTCLGVLEKGKQMHAHAYKVGFANDIIVSGALVDAYSKCRSPGDACKFFSELKDYGTVLLNSMVSVYSSCGKILEARRVFEMIPSRSVISWNSMIVGYSQNGCAIKALDLFGEMRRLDLRMDSVGLASVISACASICSLGLGEQIFALATVTGLEYDQIVSSSLVDFYCKCGHIEDGRRLFDEMMKSDEVPWNSILRGYAKNGQGIEALKLFDEMRQAGVVPNNITFTEVLSACVHCGLVEEGHRWFYAMKQDYHIEPGIEHYSCMIDLFSRAGCLEEAMDLLDRMPFEVDASMWSSMLRGCMAHRDEALGRKVAENIIELDPKGSTAYMQLSKIFATSVGLGEIRTS